MEIEEGHTNFLVEALQELRSRVRLQALIESDKEFRFQENLDLAWRLLWLPLLWSEVSSLLQGLRAVNLGSDNEDALPLKSLLQSQSRLGMEVALIR